MKCLSEIPGPEQIAVSGHPSVRLDTSVDLMLGRSKRHLGKRVLATIVATVGSTYRKSGARMLLMTDGNYLGLVSGGCLEGDLSARARAIVCEIHAWLAGRGGVLND